MRGASGVAGGAVGDAFDQTLRRAHAAAGERFDLLARVLQLEWVHEAPRVETQSPANLAVTGVLPLPQDLRERLIALARQGNASGLRSLLRGRAEQVPALAETLQVLVAYVDRFDFPALIARLRETEDASPA